MSKELLDKRVAIKKKKPKFTRQDAHKKPGLAKGWRRPRGIQSKMRLRKKGYKKSALEGWGSPKKVRGLSKTGLIPVAVKSLNDINALDPKTMGAIISASIGKKKRISILEELTKKKITVLNYSDSQKVLTALKSEFESKQKDKKKKEQEKKKKEEEKKKKEESKSKPEAKKPESDEGKVDEQQKEKKELDKVLSKPKG